MRLLLLIAAIAVIYWYWQHPPGTIPGGVPAPGARTEAPPVPNQPGGGLNPFVTDTDVGGAPGGRPPMPNIPAQR